MPKTLVLALASAVLCCGQESRGSILGRVADSSGAVVSGARVQAVETASNVKASSATNMTGSYEIPYLLPGTYSVSVEMAGFKTSVRSGIELRINDRLTLDFTLEVGDVSQSVVVTGETPLLEAATASVSMVMNERLVRSLPVNGGNPFYLARLSPGINTTGGPASGNPNGQGFATTTLIVNGTRSGSSEVSMDGSPNMIDNKNAYSPPQDLVQEFKMHTASYDASLGHSTGATVNLTMLSGANELHGTAYYLDTRVAATGWFSNRWLYDTSTGPVTDLKRQLANPGLLRQRWGATLRGPVRLPFYHGRNKTFYSFGYEGLNIKVNESFTGTVPLPEQRIGDFSGLLKLGAQYQIYDPATIAPAANGRFSRLPLAGNVIPASRIHPIAAKIATFWPAPNTPGTADGMQNFFTIRAQDRTFLSLVGRLDHNFSGNHRFFFRVNHNQYDENLQEMPTIASGTTLDRTGYGAVLDDVYVFNPELLLNVRYGITYQNPRTTPFSRGFDLLSLGFPSRLLDEIRSKNNPEGLAFPQVDVDGITSLGEGGGNTRKYAYHNLAATLTKMRGNHSVRVGVDFRVMRENAYNFGAIAPRLAFSSSYTRGPLDNSAAAPMGQGLASMLFGVPTGGNMDVNASSAEQSTFTGLFVHDDWRITPRLTLNAGVRYEYEGAVTERYNRSIQNFDFGVASPVEAAVRANYARSPLPEVPLSQFRLMGGLTFAGVNGAPRALWKPDRNNLAPRIGLAYRLDSKTVLRAGYGVFFEQNGIDRRGVNQGGFNQSTPLIASLDNGLTFAATLSNPFPNGLQMPVGAAGGLYTFLGRGVSFFNQNPLNPYMQRWSFAVQRELPRRILAQVSYVGNRGTKIGTNVQLDATPRQYLSTSPVRDQPVIDYLSAQVANPFAGVPAFAGTGLAAVRVSRAQLLAPYPHFTGITSSFANGFSYYHSLQLQSEKRFSSGLTFQANWTWSKFMEAASYLNDTDLRPEKVISSEDYPHRVTVSALYELPIGRGRRVFGSARGFVNQAIGGWQVQGFYEGQSGQALGFGNSIFYGNLHDIPLPKSQRTAERWFNVNAGFERDNRKRLQNNIRTLNSRFNGVRGDGINSFDLSLFKNFQVTEKVRAEFRAEAYNAFNHVGFLPPNTTPTSTAFGSIDKQNQGSRVLAFGVKVLF
ncbi:MAG: TonB-dependent receptor domain-containing protein [Bryobacteraceae bacterium]